MTVSDRVIARGDFYYYEGEMAGEDDAGRAAFGPKGRYDNFGSLKFQHGPVAEVGGRNGAFIEDVLEVCLTRLRELNGKFPCRENSLAITNIEQGLMWLNERTRKRVAQGVEGRSIAHVG